MSSALLKSPEHTKHAPPFPRPCPSSLVPRPPLQTRIIAAISRHPFGVACGSVGNNLPPCSGVALRNTNGPSRTPRTTTTMKLARRAHSPRRSRGQRLHHDPHLSSREWPAASEVTSSVQGSDAHFHSRGASSCTSGLRRAALASRAPQLFPALHILCVHACTFQGAPAYVPICHKRTQAHKHASTSSARASCVFFSLDLGGIPPSISDVRCYMCNRHQNLRPSDVRAHSPHRMDMGRDRSPTSFSSFSPCQASKQAFEECTSPHLPHS